MVCPCGILRVVYNEADLLGGDKVDRGVAWVIFFVVPPPSLVVDLIFVFLAPIIPHNMSNTRII